MRAFDLHRPAIQTTAVVFASPHSGSAYPEAFLRRIVLDPLAVRSSEDAFVDRLFARAPSLGAPLLTARVPRAYVDLNRAAEELDPALVEGVQRPTHNPRISSGLGVIPRVVANGRAIYRGKIGLDEAQDRLALCWRPYHEALRAVLAETHAQFGQTILIDCHSMPHEAIEASGVVGGPRPDVVLGDRFGAAAALEIMEGVEAAFKSAGLRVARNMPFAGAYVTQQYGRPARRAHAVQVEIDRSLYMDEARIEPHGGFDAFAALLAGVIAEIAKLGRPAGGAELPVAAE